MTWQEWYDNLLPEDFQLNPIENRCKLLNIEEIFFDEQIEGASTPSKP